jgi:uncharacterized membrane protein YfcA
MAAWGTHPGILLLLCSASLLAGAVDAIAGGGGLVTLPALLAAGLPPHLALGTNKGQSVFGTLAALWRYARSGWIDRQRALLFFPAGLVGAFLGALLVLRLRPEVLRPIVLVLLVCVALFLVVRGKPEPKIQRIPSRSALYLATAAALAIGAYDGFFGPGTGTFLILAFEAALALPLARASAESKVVNLASNMAALILFTVRGVVIWPLALPMAASNWTGGYLGAHLALRGGDRLVRWVVLGVVVFLSVKLGTDLWWKGRG